MLRETTKRCDGLSVVLGSPKTGGDIVTAMRAAERLALVQLQLGL